ncbi:lytic transglycosylase domain-containing protein [uncultured Capnocytophaga sp.]|jgi:membrane-bound lytic murein transglycosylase|uniref:lytic transglycosylase domain-containing protein n=1 Tax=uncultured Capnocytophaga sp. TaxID=159273 RepID=UPI0026243FDE|nr:lytic transglycosylase domain-containing protein [uncultured Capnocytophaga sp.]
MKKTYFFTLLYICSFSANSQVKNTVSDTLHKPSTNRITNDSLSSGNLREGLFHLQDNNKALKYDKKWLEELSNNSLFPLMQNDIQSTPSENVVYNELSTEVLKERLAKLDQKTPFHIEYNPILENVIKNFLKNRRSSLQRLMNISQYYFPMFEKELVKHQIPKEIKYLAIVESALNPKATSPMGAKGLWQFMYYTGKMYGLEVSNYVDDRSHPELATQAAAQYLKKLYSVFNDWDLVLAAYNSGPGNVTKAMRRSGGKTNYWNLRPYLPNETAGYVPAFLATMYIFEYAKEHGFQTQKPEKVFFETDTVQVKRHISFKDISQVVGMTEEEIGFFNPAYTLNIVPYIEGKNYGVRLPVEAIGKFVNNEDAIYAYLDQEASKRERPLPEVLSSVQASSNKRTTHKVKKGETLGRIASRYGVTVTQLKKWNNLRSTNLKAGQRIVIHK